jgi:Papain family cysteine protease
VADPIPAVPAAPGTGWIPDFTDFRDSLYNDFFKTIGKIKFPVRGWFQKTTVYPSLIDLRMGTFGGQFPPVLNQGILNDCVENAWGSALYYVDSKETQNPVMFSRLFHFWNTRQTSLFANTSTNSGTSIRASVKAIAKVGICREDLWPYDVTQYAVKPPDAAYANAVPREGISYARLVTLDDMLHCLASGYPIVFGTSIYNEFMALQNAGCANLDAAIVPLPSKTTATWEGCHSMCIVGYDLIRRLFLVRNSWGTNFGFNGDCWFPFDYLLNPLLSDDFWTIRFLPVGTRKAVSRA